MPQLMAPPPHSPVEPVTDVLHGVSVTDPYRWLEDQDSPRTRAWIEEQTRYARAYLDSINSSPSKLMTHCKTPAAAISSGSVCRTKSSLAFTCVKAQTARTIFSLTLLKDGPAIIRQ